MKKLVFVCAVCGVGKTTVCDYIKVNNLLDNYEVFDIDDLESISDYTNDTYNLFYENAIKKANLKSGNKNMLIGSCINPTDISKINIPSEIESINMIAITCSSDEVYKRLKMRDKKRNCGSDEFITVQIDYQNWMLNHIDSYQRHIDNTKSKVEDTAKEIVDYITEVYKGENTR